MAAYHTDNTLHVLNFVGYIFVFLIGKKIRGVFFNFCGNGSMVGTIVVGFAKYVSCCGLIFMDKRHTTKFMHLENLYTLKISTHMILFELTTFGG